MADILFDIGVTGVKDLKEAADSMARLGTVSSKLAAAYSPLGTQTVKVVKEQNRLKKVARDLQRAYNDNRISLEQYNQAINQEINNSQQKIKTDERLIAAAKRKQQAVDAENTRIAKLTATYRKDILAKKAYLQAQRDIRYAERQGIITQQQMQTELEKTKLEFQQFTKGLANGANQFARYNTAVYNSMQRKKRFGQVGLQQVGYQVGDFIVQIQSGTDALVAFGQQGSQLAGIFGAKGAIFGAIIAGATAIGMVYKSIVDAAKTSAEDIKAAFSTIPNYFEELGLSVFDSFDRSFSKIEERYGKLIANIAKAQLSQLKEAAVSIEGPVAKKGAPSLLDQFLGAVAPGVVGVGTPLQGEVQTDLTKQTQELYEQSIAVNEVLSSYKEQVDQVKSQSELLELVKTTHESILGINKDAAKAFESQAKELGIADAITEEINKKNEKRIEDNKKLQRAATNAMVLEAEVMEELRLEEQKRADLYLSKRRYVIDLITKAEQEAAEKVRRLESFRTEQSNKEKRNAIATIYEAERVAAIKNEDLQEFILTGRNMARMQMLRKISAAEQAEAVKQDKIQQQLDDKRQSQENKRFETYSRLRREAIASIYGAERTEILKNADLERFIIVSRNQARVQMLRIIAQAEKEFAEDEEKRRASARNIQDTIDALRDQVKQENILLGLTGERLKEEQIFYRLLEANKKADIKLSEEKIRAIARQIAAQKQANEVIQKGIDFAKDMSDVFSDFIMNGFRDFKSFVSEIGNMFKRLLAEMVAQALATKIFMPITAGFTGTMMGTAAGAATGSMIGAGAGGGALLGGIGSAAAGISSGFMGVMSGGGLGSSFANLGGLLSGSVGGLGAVGAAIPAVLAIAAVVGLFTKRVKKLDEGLRVTIDGTNSLVEVYQKLETSRLFGLLKSKKTVFEVAGADVADPVSSAVFDLQSEIMKAAESLGLATEAFKDFSYQFTVSLEGLTEEQKIAALNEELTKLGDEFTSLTGVFNTMNELLAVAQQRYDLETRLLRLQGDSSALLTRQHELELAATHELNKALLQQIHAIEQAQLAATEAAQVASQAMSAVSSAMANVERVIQNKKNSITDAFNSLMESIETRIDAANDVVTLSRSILGMLRNVSDTRMAMTRQEAISYLTQFRGGGRISDERELGRALDAVAEPTEDLFGNFVDYQRDFLDTSLLIRDLEKNAANTLSTDEKILKSALEEADLARERYEEEIELLEEQLQTARDQIDALNGIDKSVQTVEEAIGKLETAVMAAVDAQAAAEAARKLAQQAGGGGFAGANVQQANQAGQGVIDQLGLAGNFARSSDGAVFQKVNIRGADQLLDVAGSLGIKTSGLTGAEIQQAISNTGNLAVNMDNITRDMQFAKGGYFGGGVRLVGERGPELEMTGASRIMSNRDTRKMLQNPELLLAVKEMRQEISDLRSEQRQLGINNNKYTKRTYDLYRQWDTEGLPTERT